MKILGWYSFIFLITVIMLMISDNKNKGAIRVVGVMLYIPIITYVALNLFK
ncbi:hypothetical protein [Brassicibacter mesophilus]|uniref:hypothetical protein n=1 Tax=Brassicibacter mesophilus TaxID=745119 RepID=UPI003D1CC0E4